MKLSNKNNTFSKVQSTLKKASAAVSEMQTNIKKNAALRKAEAKAAAESMATGPERSFFSKMRECVFNKRGNKTSIFMRIVRFTFISALVFIVALVPLTILLGRSNTTNAYTSKLLSFAKISSDAVTNWMDKCAEELEFEATKADIFNESLSLDERIAILKADAVGKEFTDFSVSYSDGKTYNNTDISDRDYFKKAISGTTFMSDPVLRKTNNSITIMAGTKSRVPGHDGIVYGGISVDFLDELLKDLDLGSIGYGFMVNKDGVIISYPDVEFVTNMVNPITMAKTDPSFAPFANVVSKMVKGETFIDKFVMPDGIEYIGGFAPIEGSNGWSIGVLMQYYDITHEFNKITNTVIIASIVLFILLLGVNLLVVTKLSYPIRSASIGLEALAEGNLSSDFEKVAIRSDEVGNLTTSLYDMKSKLNAYIGDIANVLNNLSNGNLNIGTTAEYAGEFVQIKDNLNNIIDSLNKTFSSAGEASVVLFNGARQVETASQQLASASTQQASAIVEITASIEGIAKSSDENTRDVLRVNELTQTAKNEAASGNAMMTEMIDAMNDISEASKQIAGIIKVIDGIAFQTNILSLNASVEAARAGIHGRGFAVVADEVRNLASKSADASAEIGEMIQSSLKKIENGSLIVERTAEELSKIVTDIDEIAEIMDHIADVSKDQAEAVSQVNSGISQISDGVQNNSATSEECAASSVQLSEQARTLMKNIQFYKLKK